VTSPEPLKYSGEQLSELESQLGKAYFAAKGQFIIFSNALPGRAKA